MIDFHTPSTIQWVTKTWTRWWQLCVACQC